jgi:hypothetical protein
MHKGPYPGSGHSGIMIASYYYRTFFTRDRPTCDPGGAKSHRCVEIPRSTLGDHGTANRMSKRLAA